MGIEVFKKHLREKRAIKISTGIDNYNLDSIASICRAAQKGHASAVDIACDKKIYDTARKNTKLPIFVSSIHPFELQEAVKWGADAIEIGGFEALYKNGITYSAQEIYDITLETMSLVEQYDIFVSVTIPGDIDTNEQIELAKNLEILGVDLIQTEGYKKIDTKMIPSVQMTIENANNLVQSTKIPVMAGCGMTPDTVVQAFNKGVSAVGISTPINKLGSEALMNTTILSTVSSISYRNSINKEIIRTTRELSLR